MNHLAKMGLVLLGLLITSAVSPAEEWDSTFESFFEAYTAAWNTHDGDAVAVFFTADADLIMGSLPRITGRESISKWWDTYFSQIDEGRKGEFKLFSLEEIAPDVRIVNVSSTTSGENRYGEELETRFARGTWVLVKRDETWLIAAMRGLPAEGEQRFHPGVDR